MLPQREIRYYFSILKLMLLLLASLAFVAIGWPMIHSGANPIIAGLGVGFFGLGALVILGELILTVIFRLPMLDKPALQITDDGISSVLPFTPWARSFVPWADVARINIRRRRYARREERPFDEEIARGAQRHGGRHGDEEHRCKSPGRRQMHRLEGAVGQDEQGGVEKVQAVGNRPER